MGLNLTAALLRDKWTVYGLSRRKQDFLPPEVRHISVDLTSKDDCHAKFASLHDVTHVFYATWVKTSSEAENCEVNAAMVENLLDNLPSGFKHFVLVTGTKHYMGSNEMYAKLREEDLETPFKETLPRQPGQNFYYAQEDVVFEKAAHLGFTWSVARPHMIIGYAPNNQMNVFTSLAVYASLCKYIGHPFVFPGSKVNYFAFFDAVDAETVLAEHLIWEATSPSATNQAFNVVNGDAFRWKTLWQKIAEYFEIEAVGPGEQPINMQEKMSEKESVWKEMVSKFGLKNYELSEVATWWLVSSTTSRKASCLTDMTKSREMGFLKYQSTEKSVFRLFDRLRAEKIIP